jgi:DNA-binding transcriptional MerR regulator
VSDSGQPAPARPRKGAAAFRTIGETAEELDVPAHVLRFWETKFPQIKPVKRGGGRRYYRPEDIELLRRIRQWLHRDGYTIRGVQQLLENRPSGLAASGSQADIADPFTATAPEAAAAAELASGSEAAATGLSEAARHEPDRRSGLLDPAMRAELEAIRRELLQARTLLDDLLRQLKISRQPGPD